MSEEKRTQFDYQITEDKWTPIARIEGEPIVTKNLDAADFTVLQLYEPQDFEGSTTINIRVRKIDGHKIIEQNSFPTFEWNKHSFHITILKEDYDELDPKVQGNIYFTYEAEEPINQSYGETYSGQMNEVNINYVIQEIARRKHLQGMRGELNV